MGGREREGVNETPDAWRGWMEVSHNTATIAVGIGALEANETTAVAVLVKKDCPPTAEASDFSFSLQLTADSGEPLVTEEFLDLFEECAMREPHGTWFFAVLCLQGARCPFRINVWVTPITMAWPGVKLFGSVEAPHVAFHVVSVTAACEVDLLVKVKAENDTGREVEADALHIHRRFEDCPTLSPYESPDDDEVLLSSPEALDSAVYAYAYRDSFAALEEGTWYVAVVPSLPCVALPCAAVEYSLLADVRFLCIPPCQNGGVCSETLENTCVCPDDGHTGDRCQLTQCLPMCEHGQCVGANECVCDEGWMGPTCIDIDHAHAPVPFGHFASSTPASTYAVVALLSVLVLVAVALVAVFALSCEEGSVAGRLKARLQRALRKG